MNAASTIPKNESPLSPHSSRKMITQRMAAQSPKQTLAIRAAFGTFAKCLNPLREEKLYMQWREAIHIQDAGLKCHMRKQAQYARRSEER